MEHVSQHVFATFTYKREHDLVGCWKRVTKDYNRFITNYRRLHRDGVEYIRSIEAHRDGYPHIHAVLQHKSGILVSNGRYFERNLYQKWKQLWSSGLSDFQAPRAGSLYPTLYIVKYISKHSTLKTLWQKFYTEKTSIVTSVLNADQNTPPSSTPQTVVHPMDDTLFFCKQFKIKQCTWSRAYKFPTKRPVSLLVGQSLLTPSQK